VLRHYTLTILEFDIFDFLTQFMMNHMTIFLILIDF